MPAFLFTRDRIKSVLLTLFVLFPSVWAVDKPIAIINAVVIDGMGGPPLEGGSVIIRGDKIEAVGDQLHIPSDATVIDAVGRTVMPGLADMHVHLSWGGEGHDLLGYQRRLNALLYAGVTTVLDTGGVLPFVMQMKQAVDAGVIHGPNIYYVGPLIDGVDPTWPAVSLVMASRDQAPTIAEYLKTNGASAIKAYGNLSSPQVRALVRAGVKKELPVIVDSWVRNGAEHLVGSGLHAFAHTPFRVTDETLAVMKEKQVYIISTRAVGGIPKVVMVKGLSIFRDDLILETTPPWLLAKARVDGKRALEKDDTDLKKWYDKLQANVKRIFDAGIPLVAGTDNDGLFIGASLHLELEILVDAGLTPLQAITTATRNAALLMGDGDQWGTLESGKRADLLLVNGRPDKKITDTRKIELVMKAGAVIPRESLAFNEATDRGIRDTKFAYDKEP